MLVDTCMPSLTNFLCRLEGDWDVEPEQAWSAASESSLNPMSRLEDVSWADFDCDPVSIRLYTTFATAVPCKIFAREYSHERLY